MGYRALRFCVLFFNVLFFFSGVALFGYGIYLRVEEDDYADICEQYSWANGANLCIAAGVLIFFIAAFGCLGAAMKSSVLLSLFFFCLLLIFIMELAAGVLCFVYRQELNDEVEDCMKTTLARAQGGRQKYQDAWKAAEDTFDCCGITDTNRTNYNNDVCPATTVGCLDKFTDDAKEFLVIIGGLCIGLTLVEILGMIFAIVLVIQINKEKKNAPKIKSKEDYGKF